mgnify:CR=1 FL=1
MRIDAYNQISQIYQTTERRKNSVYGSDKVEISQFGKDYRTAKQAVADAPDVRADKVADIKAKIDSGSYEVSSEDFAAKLAEKYGTTLF